MKVAPVVQVIQDTVLMTGEPPLTVYYGTEVGKNSENSDFGPVNRYISETIDDRHITSYTGRSQSGSAQKELQL